MPPKFMHKMPTFLSVILYLFTFVACLMMADAFGDVTFEANQYPDILPIWQDHKLDLLMMLSCLVFWYFAHKHKEKWRDNIFEDNVLSSHITGQFLTWIALAIGIYSSVTSAAFLKWFSPSGTAIGSADYGIDIVLGLIALTLFGFIKHGIHSAAKSERQDEQQKAYINELHETIRLAPPGTFPHRLALYADVLEDFASEGTVSEWNEYILIPEEDRLNHCDAVLDCQRAVIRASLVALARLAGHYDNAPLGNGSHLQYRANLMLTTHAQNSERLLAIGDAESFETRFNIGITATPQYQLILDSRYSVLVDSDDVSIIEISQEDTESGSQASFKPCSFQPDPQVRNAIFPVYWSEDKTNTFTYYNMIGAPKALATCHPQFIPDTVQHSMGLRKEGYPAPLAKQAEDYFASDEKGRSIVSLPISSQRFLDESLKPANMVGIVNIYRNKKDIFSGSEKNFELFSAFTLPLQLALARIIGMHIAVLEDKAELQQAQSTQGNSKGQQHKNNGNKVGDEIY